MSQMTRARDPHMTPNSGDVLTDAVTLMRVRRIRGRMVHYDVYHTVEGDWIQSIPRHCQTTLDAWRTLVKGAEVIG